MNKNEYRLQEIKNNLLDLLNKMPDQFALAEVKSNLRRTIESINHVQTKRERRKIQEQQNNSQKLPFLSLQDAQKALDILNQMGKQQQNIIDNAQKDNDKTTDEFLLG